MVQGSLVAIVTPFTNDGQVNFDILTSLLNWHVEKGTNGIVVLGTTGEAATLSEIERLAVIKHTVAVINKRIPVIAGVGSNNTIDTLRYAKAVEQLGVDGFLIVNPYYNKGNNQGLINHYKLLHDELSTPIIVYNVPSRTGLSLPLSVIEEIARYKRIIGIKEASGDLSYLISVKNIVPKDFLIYSGSDDLVIPSLSIGCDGVISVAANIIPDVYAKMVDDYLAGNINEARNTQLQYVDFIHALFVEINPIPVKALMNLIGLNVGGYRLPLYPPTEQTMNLLRTIKERYNL